jgi:hypothetical protein
VRGDSKATEVGAAEPQCGTVMAQCGTQMSLSERFPAEVIHTNAGSKLPANRLVMGDAPDRN